MKSVAACKFKNHYGYIRKYKSKRKCGVIVEVVVLALGIIGTLNFFLIKKREMVTQFIIPIAAVTVFTILFVALEIHLQMIVMQAL